MSRTVGVVLGGRDVNINVGRMRSLLTQHPDLLIVSSGYTEGIEESARDAGYDGKILFDKEPSNTYENLYGVKRVINSNDLIIFSTEPMYIPGVKLASHFILGNNEKRYVANPSNLDVKSFAYTLSKEIAAILKDLMAISLCRVHERKDIYDKTLRRIKEVLI